MGYCSQRLVYVASTISTLLPNVVETHECAQIPLCLIRQNMSMLSRTVPCDPLLLPQVLSKKTVPTNVMLPRKFVDTRIIIIFQNVHDLYSTFLLLSFHLENKFRNHIFQVYIRNSRLCWESNCTEIVTSSGRSHLKTLTSIFDPVFFRLYQRL